MSTRIIVGTFLVVDWPLSGLGLAPWAIVGASYGVAIRLLAQEETPVPHHTENRPRPTEEICPCRRVQDTLQKRTTGARSEMAAVKEGTITPGTVTKPQLPVQTEFCGPWAA